MGSGSSQELGGVRVFKVSPGSPAAEAGLEVFFDFIMEVNGVKMDPGYQQTFAQKIQESENTTAKLTVFNTRAHAVREVVVKPRKWAGKGLLGATVRFDSVDPAENHGIRVLEVFVNSPAAHAGLVPFQDFLLGTETSVFHDIDELVEAVTTSINRQLQVYVYNADSETVREVPLVPNNDWGGEGCIGCDIGTGLLHRIPAPRRPPGAQADGLAGAPGAATSWASAAGLPPPAYPPGAGPQVAAPAPAAPAAVPVVPGVPAATSVTGVPLAPGIPQVPSAPVGAGGMPAISVGGAWAPAAPAVPLAGAGPALGQPAQASPVTPATMAQLQAQIQQLGTAPAPAPPAAKVAGVSWPPQPKQPQQQVTLPVAADTSPTGLPVRMPSEMLPQAPPSTPMNEAEMPPPVDFSALDPSRFAAPNVVAGGFAQPGAAVL